MTNQSPPKWPTKGVRRVFDMPIHSSNLLVGETFSNLLAQQHTVKTIRLNN